MAHWLDTVHHDGSEKYVTPLTPQLGDTVHLRLRVGEFAPVQRVYLRYFPNGEQTLIPMQEEETESPARWYRTALPIEEPLVHYRFLLQADDGVWWYTAAGPTAHEPLDNTDFRLVADYEGPDWLYGAVFYQIFPDSFANGDPTNDPRPGEYEYLGAQPHTIPWDEPYHDTHNARLTFYGGDLQGTAEHLDHLARLGVNAIYLNPIFGSLSVHRYDITDYDHVDPHLGGDEALIALRAALDARGMRCILDMVPNHCGCEHPWLRTAQTDHTSPEAGFFFFHNGSNEYECWLGHKSLPKLNYTSPELRHRMYAGEDAIFRRWLREPYRMDGWRVDVGNMLGRQGRVQMNAEVARGIRQAVKETRPDAYLIAENFFEASAQLQGDQWDAVMNYRGLTQPLWHWLSGYRTGAIGLQEGIVSPIPYTTQALETTWRLNRAAIPWVIALQQYNVLDSHDTPRIRTIVQGNDALHRLAAIVQMTLPGVPGIYYGDEIGMINEDRPHDGARGAMIWDEARWDQDLFTFYQHLIALRKESRTLQQGGLQMLALEPDMFAYQRETHDGRVIVVVQRSAEPRPARALAVSHGGVPDGTHFVKYFTGQKCTVIGGALPLPELPQGATIYIAAG